MRSGLRVTGLVSALVFVLSSCGAGGNRADERGSNVGEDVSTTVRNCGHAVKVKHRPHRVVALGPSEVTSLYAAGGATRLVGRDDAGMKSAPYTPAIRKAVSSVPQLSSGGEVTRESIIALNPDLVVGSVSETVTPETLGAVDIPMLSLRGNCGSNHAPGASDGTSDFDDVFSDVRLFGRLLGKSEHASATVSELRRRVDAAKTAGNLHGETAASVIVYDNGLEAYGRRSMAHTQFRKLGAKNVFQDVDSRVVEANIEKLVAHDPDRIMILSYGDTDKQAKEKFLKMPGVSNLTAVRKHHVFVQPYECSSQGVLSVNGLENMAKDLARTR